MGGSHWGGARGETGFDTSSGGEAIVSISKSTIGVSDSGRSLVLSSTIGVSDSGRSLVLSFTH